MSAIVPIPGTSVRGVRQSLNPGTVIGRVSGGFGAAEQIPISALGRQLVKSGTVAPGPMAASAQSYLGFFLQGPLQANHIFYGAISHKTLIFPSAIAASFALAEIACTANVIIPLYFSGIGQVGTITFTAGGTAGTVNWLAPPYTLAANIVPYIVGPNILDLTIAGISILLAGDVP